MNRRYSAQEYAEKCDLIRRYYPAPALTTDVIVGFPMETEEDFEESYEFVKNIHFSAPPFKEAIEIHLLCGLPHYKAATPTATYFPPRFRRPVLFGYKKLRPLHNTADGEKRFHLKISRPVR